MEQKGSGLREHENYGFHFIELVLHVIGYLSIYVPSREMESTGSPRETRKGKTRSKHN